MRRYFFFYSLIVFGLVGCNAEKEWLHKDARNWQSTQPSLDQPEHSLFLIGDAGKASDGDQVLVALERQLKVREKDAVVFLGDNLYPVGLRKKDDPGREEDEAHLRAQVDAVATHAGQMVFVPGNHDWEQGGRNGYKNVRRAERFVEKAADRGNVWLPDDGCPGPVVVPLADDAILVVIDTQWWLHPYEKPSHEYDCEVKYNADFIEMLEGVLQENRDKKIVVVGHHPLYSYGAHGGHYPLHAHLFPGVMAKKNAFIPLPGLGTLGIIYRKAWGNIQDIPHPIYQEMKKELTEVFSHHPDVVYASGHDHNLQYLPIKGTHYIVSGSGSKTKYVAKGNKARFTADKRGFVRLDYYKTGEVWANYFIVDAEAAETLAFRTLLFTKPAPKPKTVLAGPFPVYTDSLVTVFADDRYERGNFFQKLFGENYREEWKMEVKVPVLDLWSMGYTVEQKGGGHQTKSLRLADSEGRHYALRSIKKYPELATPEMLRKTIGGKIIQDQISGEHPYGAFAVAPLAEAVGVYHTNPKLVWLPNDPRLGIYQESFGGDLYLFEERPADDRSDIASFGNSEKIISTLKMVEKLHDDNDHRVDQKAALQARLLDIWMGDWDRHDDQWRWAKFKEDGLTIYRPIPRDRDVVFFRPEGLVLRIALRKWLLNSVQEFDPEIRDLKGYGLAARFWDRSFITEPSRQDWIDAALHMQEVLTDSLIEEALKGMPQEIAHISNKQIARFLRTRRDDMVQYAEKYYEFLAKEVDVLGSNEEERFEVDRLEDGSTRVRMWNLKNGDEKGQKLYDRTFYKKETREIRLWGMEGEDEFYLDGEASKGIKVRVIMGDDKDKLRDKSTVSGMARKTLVYDEKDKKNDIEGKSELRPMLSNHKEVNEYDRRAFNFDKVAPLLDLGFNIDDGIFLGGGANFRKYRFRKTPYALNEVLKGKYAIGTGAFDISFSGEYPQAVWGWDFVADAAIQAPNFVQNFYGFGNETTIFEPNDKAYHRTRYNRFIAQPGLRKQLFHGNGGFSIYGFAEYTDVERTANLFITDIAESVIDSTAGFDPKFFAGAGAELNIDSRDSKVFPTRGFQFMLKGEHFQGINSGTKSFQKAEGAFSMYLRFRIPLITVLALRAGGGISGADAPFFHHQYLGGTTNLRGHRKARFAGQSAFYQNTELRIQLAEFKSILLPARFGILLVNDIGRVWIDGENSSKMHWGYGGGIWITPYEFTALTVTYSGSEDGWLPYVTLGWMF